MISFVNAKINLGLQIVRKRKDGYHDLQTVFYPVGKYAGTAENPECFCDILEVIACGGELGADEKEECAGEKGDNSRIHAISLSGRRVACPVEKNLVYKASQLFCEEMKVDLSGISIMLEKHLPDGAGMGGGSADASFTLRLLADIFNRKNPEAKIEDRQLYEMALRLGADCPFFILNRPAYAEGIGERLQEIPLDLSGYWLGVVKPDIYVSTKEAFSGVIPGEPDFDLRKITDLPINLWKDFVHNDFEDSIFPLFPAIGEIKKRLYDYGALYASMSGSGSSVYAIFSDRETASLALTEFKGDATIEGCYLLKL
ncbi:MAG: 4-(cytidine 5'-diphospho)-2-C-methyl-D-erythritol kinase [Muribaculaceae bacterium]|nr:4-(cytidine 5'-diphospho)-2-C-methyl-D-erythritol kinase [Muribaculaceae bacterium]